MRELTYSGQGCVTSMSPLAPSHPKPPPASAAPRPNAISRLASARRHGAVPGSLTIFLLSQGHAGSLDVARWQLTRSSRDQVDRKNGPAAYLRLGVLEALDESFDGDTAEPGGVLIQHRDRGRKRLGH